MKEQEKTHRRAQSNLKALLDDEGYSIRGFAEETGLPFETLRRLYNDTTKQYQRDTIGRICEALGVEVGELLTLREEE